MKEQGKFIGFETKFAIECGASSAIAITTRRVLGRLGHLEFCKAVATAARRCRTGEDHEKVAGAENSSDSGTMFLSSAALDGVSWAVGSLFG